jgi:hypothetical protein
MKLFNYSIEKPFNPDSEIGGYIDKIMHKFCIRFKMSATFNANLSPEEFRLKSDCQLINLKSSVVF